ncbi:MAG: DUF952 domain-containing protein [Thermomicrobiales bacterium]
MSSQIHGTAEASRKSGIGYHLIPEPVWNEFRDAALYRPEAYEQDGFIHLTLGVEPLLAVANLFYTKDDRAYRVLVLDMAMIQAPVRYEDPDETYPHVYGLLNLDAVVGELAVERTADGTFKSIGAA